MAHVIPGRFTSQTDEPIVVFLIGMRINKFFAFRKWVPTARAMGPMLRELMAQPEKGFLGGQLIFYWRGVGLIQYWRSLDDLERFARDQHDLHWPAWRRFNQQVGYQDGSVGFWHESYLTQSGQRETIYANMPVFGLAAATAHVPAHGQRETARGRRGAQAVPAAPAAAELSRTVDEGV